MNRKVFLLLLVVTVLMMLFAASAFALSHEGVGSELASQFGVIHSISPVDVIASQFGLAG